MLRNARVAAIIFVGVVVLAAGSACGRGNTPVSQGAGGGPLVVDVGTARAGWLPVTRVLRVTGSLMADEEAEVAAETTGRVIDTPVERGSRVEAGSPLVKLAQTEAQASLVARRTLHSAAVNASATRRPRRPLEDTMSTLRPRIGPHCGPIWPAPVRDRTTHVGA